VKLVVLDVKISVSLLGAPPLPVQVLIRVPVTLLVMLSIFRPEKSTVGVQLGPVQSNTLLLKLAILKRSLHRASLP
jgi:hypothetical protein